MDEPVETDAQLRQHRVHVFAIHGLPHVLHLPADVHADLGAGLVWEGGLRIRNIIVLQATSHYVRSV